jgi:hypothetical protein
VASDTSPRHHHHPATVDGMYTGREPLLYAALCSRTYRVPHRVPHRQSAVHTRANSYAHACYPHMLRLLPARLLLLLPARLIPAHDADSYARARILAACSSLVHVRAHVRLHVRVQVRGASAWCANTHRRTIDSQAPTRRRPLAGARMRTRRRHGDGHELG